MLTRLVTQVVHSIGRGRRELENFPTSNYYDERELARLITRKAHSLRGDYMDYPALVHVETLAVCNAACSFCPYSDLERKGTRMPDSLIEKIIGDLTDIPRTLGFQFCPYKVSDPFLESRLFDILARVDERLPNARVSLITNGSAMTDRNLDALSKVRGIAHLTVSLNYHDPVEYEEVMRIPLDRTLARLDSLHRRKSEGKVSFPVRLTRVSVTRDEDMLFARWCAERYPLFPVAILPRNDWLGNVSSDADAAAIPDAPCHRWFDLSITATGAVAMCCMDGKAEFPKGDVTNQHVLDIYNQPRLRKLRSDLASRLAVGSPCDRCTYLSY